MHLSEAIVPPPRLPPPLRRPALHISTCAATAAGPATTLSMQLTHLLLVTNCMHASIDCVHKVTPTRHSNIVTGCTTDAPTTAAAPAVAPTQINTPAAGCVSVATAASARSTTNVRQLKMSINICEESTDALASTDALRAVEMTYENNSTRPQQAVFYDGITYADSDEDGAETKDDYSCEMEDGLERGA